MDDYIRRGAAIEQFEDSTSAIPEKLARIRIEEIPAADVRPVVRGKWLESDNGPMQKCSVCGATGCDIFYYCPNCGAKNGGQDE